VEEFFLFQTAGKTTPTRFLRLSQGLCLSLFMLVALLMAHMNELFALSKTGGWAIELQAFYLFNAVALFFLGAGKYAMKN